MMGERPPQPQQAPQRGPPQLQEPPPMRGLRLFPPGGQGAWLEPGLSGGGAGAPKPGRALLG